MSMALDLELAEHIAKQDKQDHDRVIIMMVISPQSTPLCSPSCSSVVPRCLTDIKDAGYPCV